jgi:type VI secretion system secreted protein Hcp
MPIYIKFDGITGDVTAAGFEGSIEVLSFSWGLSNTGTIASGSGGGAGKASFQDLHFETSASKASPVLAKNCATGEHNQKATLSVVKSAQGKLNTYYKVVLEDVLVSSFQSAGAGDEGPEESISLAFAKIEFDYYPQNADGTSGDQVQFTWDLALNKIP